MLIIGKHETTLILGFQLKVKVYHDCIWDSVQLNHPYGTFSKFPEQAKEK